MTKDYEVGYGKPPRKTQFKKGQSGNPKGRKKVEPQTILEALESEGRKLLLVNVGGTSEHLSQDALSVKRLYQKSLGGDLGALRLLLKIKADAAVAHAVKEASKPVSFTLNFGDDDDITKPWNQSKLKRPENKSEPDDVPAQKLLPPPAAPAIENKAPTSIVKKKVKLSSKRIAPD